MCYKTTLLLLVLLTKPLQAEQRKIEPVKSIKTELYAPRSPYVKLFGRELNFPLSKKTGSFENFLVRNTTATKQDQQYRLYLQEISHYLLEKNSTKNQLYCLKLLQYLSKYPADQEISGSLLQAVNAVRNNQKHQNQTKEQLKKQRLLRKKLLKQIKRGSTKINWDARRTIGQGLAITAPRIQINSPRIQELHRNLNALKTIQKNSKQQLHESEKQAHLAFQALLTQLFMQRRFEHVVIGCRFYYLLFSDFNQKIEFIENSPLQHFFQQSLNLQPSVASLEVLALEALWKTQSLILASRKQQEKQQLHTAAKQLEEAFYLGEHTSHFSAFSTIRKEAIFSYLRDSRKLKIALKENHYKQAYALHQHLKKTVKDYPYAEVEVKLQQIQQHKLEKARQQKQAAAQQQNTHNNNKRINEELKKEEQSKEKHQQQLKSKKKEKTLLQRFNQANLERQWINCQNFYNQGNLKRAWDQCDALLNQYPNHFKAKEMLKKIEKEEFKYVQLIHWGRMHTKNKEYGSALACYFTAREQNGDSPQIKEEINKLYQLKKF